MANKKVSQLTSKPSVLTTDLFPIADPSTGQLFKTTISDLGTAIGSGVSSVNSLVGAVVLDTDDIQELVSPTNKWFTDTRARAALSASSPLTYNSGTGVFGIQVANGSQNGYLSSADWTTFNAKQAALSGTGFVKISGNTISYDNSTYLTTSAAASTYLALAGGELTGALLGTSAAFSGYVGIGNSSPLYNLDVTGSGRFSGDLRIESTNPRIYLTDTDNNPDYFISNTDGTFTVYDVTNSTARFTIGTTGNATFTNAITGGGSITGQSLYSNGIISAGSSVSATRLILTGGTSPTGLYFGHTDKVVLANYTVGGGIDFETNGGNITMQLSSAGALSVTAGISGTTGLFTSTLRANSEITTYNGSNFGYWGVDSGNSYVYFGTSSTGYALSFQTGGTQRLGIASTGAATFSSSVTAASFISDGATSEGVIKIERDTVGTNTVIGSLIFTNNNGATTYGKVFGGRNSAGDGYVALGTGVSNNLYALESGNVGIGTTSPASKLHIEGTGTGAWLTINRTDSGTNLVDYTQSGTRLGYIGYIGSELWINNATASDISIRTSGSERMRITSSGNVGIGTTSPTSYSGYTVLHINGQSGTGSGVVRVTSADGTAGFNMYADNAATFNTTSAIPILFRTQDTERMRITSGGDLNIGGTGQAFNSVKQQIWFTGSSSQYGLSIAALNVGSTRFIDFNIGSGSGGQAGSISWNGSVVAYNITSDYRLKEDLKPINGLDIVNKIKVYDYKWKADNSRMDGVLAHELQEVLPYAVTGVKDGEQMQSVDYSKIVPVLIQSIKELKSKIETLENK